MAGVSWSVTKPDSKVSRRRGQAASRPRLEHMLGMQAVAAHWGELPPREREILLMHFRGGMTQTQIGQRLGISQMHVSRLITHALGYLRSRLLDLDGTC